MMNEDRQLATWTLHKQDNDDIYLVAGQILHCGRRPIINLWFLATLEAAKRDLWQMDFELSRKVELFFRMVNILYYWFLCMHTLCQKSYFCSKIELGRIFVKSSNLNFCAKIQYYPWILDSKMYQIFQLLDQ